MEKIAIIGLSCLFPDAETPEQFWQNLLAQKDSTSVATAEQMGVDAEIFFDPVKGTQNKYYFMRGGYIRGFNFDARGYHLPASYIESLDDLYKWPLHVSKQALLDSGYYDNPAVLNGCGLVLGNLSFPTISSHHLLAPIYQQAIESATRKLLQTPNFSLKTLPPIGPVSPHNLMISGYPATFVSQALALGGINFALDAACASSHYALKLAAQYLLTGKANLMLAGAVSRADPFFISMGFSIFQAYPENGASHPLNKSSRGLITGEGAGMFVLKRHSDAVRDGDKIYAVISGIGLSNDGRGKFLLQPNPKGQILAFERAYVDAGINPKSIDYVECHATGTPIGDKTEISSMDSFFGRYQAAPYVGSVKSNFGHLLTTAGMAGMIKVIYSMAHQQIPATLNLTDPLASTNNVIAPNQIVKETTAWPGQDTIKRAAINAFGFGGTNAHLILESEAQPAAPTPSPSAKTPMAIIGMDVFFGACDGLDAFGRTIYNGDQHFIPVPPGRWQGLEHQPDLLKAYGFESGKAPLGAYIAEFDLDFLHYKIPPNDDQPIPQQLLILKVADRALKDAGLQEGGNVAVIIATGTELALHHYRNRCDLMWQIEPSVDQSDVQLLPAQLAALETITKDSVHESAEVNQYISYIGNIMATRVSALWDFSGPAFTLSAEENSAFKALEVAQMLLAAGEVDAVVVGAVDLAGGAENVLLRNQMKKVNSGPPTLSFDRNANGWLVGEGAGAVVLKRHADALQAQDRVYAVINAVSVVQGTPQTPGTVPSPAAEGVAQSCRQALAEVGITPADIGYLEIFGSGIAVEDEAEITGLTTGYRTSTPDLSCAIGSIKANIGHTYAASGIASLIKTAYCLYHRYIPATPQWSEPKLADAWVGTPFYVPADSRPWFLESGAKRRLAAINGLGADCSYAHLILSDEPGQPQPANNYLPYAGYFLFPLAGDGQSALTAQLSSLEHTIEAADSLVAAARETFEVYQQQPQAAYAMAVIGRDKHELGREIRLMRKGLEPAFVNGTEWKTPLGSYFTASPLGQNGKVAFVYPGAFSSYPGMGRDILHLFPQLHHVFNDQVPDPSELMGAKHLYPRKLKSLSEMELGLLTLQLMDDSLMMLQSGTIYSSMVTRLLREQFKIQPQAALGYSLGEMSMMFALNVWSPADNTSSDDRVNWLFKEQLSGPKNAVRQFWGLPAGQADDYIWAIFVVKAPPDVVKKAMEGVERVYLTHINTPGEVVIAGDPKACNQVIQTLKCETMQIPYSHVIHCEPMRSTFDVFMALNTLPLANPPTLNYYFAASETVTSLTSAMVGRNIAEAISRQVDFPKLVERAYADGARVFLELGPRSACTWWIKDILKNKAHLAASINRRSKTDQAALVLLLGQLVSHRVALDLAPLYQKPALVGQKERSLVRTVKIAYRSIYDTILTEENRQKFANLPPKAIAPPVQNTIVESAVRRAEPLKQAINQQNIAIAVPVATVQLLKEPKVNDNLMTKDFTMPPPPPVNPPPEPTQLGQPTPSQPPPPTGEEQTSPRFGGIEGGKIHQLRNSYENPADFFNRQLQALSQNTTRANQGHAAFLRTRQEALRQMTVLIQQHLNHFPQDLGPVTPPTNGAGLPSSATLVPRVSNYSQPEQVIWNQTDLIEFATGKIAPVFGEAYAIIDTYHRRVRLPAPPYLLVSRITQLNAQCGVYQPSTMTTEYDIPFDAWYTTDGQIPWAVSVESGQCDLMLISYIGIDFENQGKRVYRLLDSTLTFLEDIPLEGHTLRYDISIDSYARSGASLLFFFSYNCFVGDTMVLKMRNGCAGFFSDEELATGKGIITTEKELAAKQQIQKRHFEPLRQCAQTSFNRDEILQLSRGEIAACFGQHYDQHGLNPSLRLPPEGILMIDRITTVDPKGGAWGLGLIVSEKDLEPEHWYFPCHFIDDQVIAGSLVAEGCSQLLQFFVLYLGFQTQTQDARFQPMPNVDQVVRTRRQITACSAKLIYRMEITDIGLLPQPYAKANVDIIFEGRVVVDFKNLGIQLSEKWPDDPYRMRFLPEAVTPSISPSVGPQPVTPVKPALFTEYHIQEFAMGSVANCFGPEFEIFVGRRVPRTPNGDLKLVNRIVEINGKRLVFNNNPNLISEVDIPADPWFCTQNAYPIVPYSILMEISLQPCGFLSAYLGSTMPYPDEDFYFRNLDGDGKLLKVVDIRGKTIANRVEMLSSTAIKGIIIQKFTYQLSCQGEIFFEGFAVFGYFQGKSLTTQNGLDQGRVVKPWFEQQDISALSVIQIDLTSAAAVGQFYQPPAEKPFYHLARQKLNLLDMALVIAGGGRHGQGYVYASKTVYPQEWFFACHFFEDPVMPGSLGVEAALQAMQLYALQQNLGAHLQSPHFTHLEHHQVIWVYRGQLSPEENCQLSLEVHISSVESSTSHVTILADVSLWKDNLRIYEVKQLALCLAETS